MIRVVLPLRLVSEANARDHWRVVRKRHNEHRMLCGLMVCAGKREPMAPPYRITLTRLGPGRLDPDNLAGSFKGVIDGIANALGIDDGDRRLSWIYQQEKSPTYAVRITVEEIRP